MRRTSNIVVGMCACTYVLLHLRNIHFAASHDSTVCVYAVHMGCMCACVCACVCVVMVSNTFPSTTELKGESANCSAPVSVCVQIELPKPSHSFCQIQRTIYRLSE